jgi:diphosphomevalonate decarboxylase
MTTATAQSHPNIAFIKYWGNRDSLLRLPSNTSISMNLDGLFTRTTVTFGSGNDSLTINGMPVSGAGLGRISAFLDIVRGMAGMDLRAEVVSTNTFPSGAGIASSASAFAALALAASRAAGLDLSEAELSRLARGSGSAPFGARRLAEWRSAATRPAPLRRFAGTQLRIALRSSARSEDRPTEA